MRLTVVGCSGSLPGPASPASCYLVEAEGFRLVLDLGNGALGALQRHPEPRDVGAIGISHLHPDHYLDLCPWLVAARYDPRGAFGPVPVLGPAATAERVAAAYDTTLQAVAHCLTVTSWQEMQHVGPFTVRTSRVDHPVEAYAVRVEHGGRVLVYSGDTDACPQLVELARDADLFLCEAAYVEGRDPDRHVHLTGRRAGEAAAAAGVRRLLLTHVPPWTAPAVPLAEARAVYGGPMEMARPDAVYEV